MLSTKHGLGVNNKDLVVTSQKPGLALHMYAGMGIWI